MAELFMQVPALMKKEFRMLKRVKNYILLELFGPLTSLCAIIYGIFLGQDAGINISPLAVPFFLRGTIIGITYRVVAEKQFNYKEYLRVNGASLYSYMASLFLFNFIRSVIIIIILFVGIIAIVGLGHISNPIFSFISLVLYAIAFLNFTLMLTVFFSSPKLASDVISLVMFLITFAYYGVVLSSHTWIYYLACLLPPIACLFSSPIMSGSSSNAANFTPDQAFIMQLINCFLYFLLYGFLDRVIPSDNGIKDPLFGCLRRKPRQVDTLYEPKVDVSSAEHHEAFHNPLDLKRTVFVDNVSKSFGKNIAVDRITFAMFERQIFCLLGHNGAGKTTMINIMTGLLRPDSGRIFYEDQEFADRFEQIRRKFGLCVQKDLLYDDLTAKEHLELILCLRGVPKNQIHHDILILSQKLGIESELDKLSKNLSGGNKRKLSLALAVAGDTKVIFLDEPTSGMDPDARRHFWDLVRSLRDEGKTILLTTHNLDEADELADRIAVMSRGELLVLGTSNYLKKKYGVGYNLILTPKIDSIDEFLSQKESLIKQVKTMIHHIEVDTKTSAEMIKMVLPYTESSKFSELFEILENQAFLEISLELNTLEDAFVNIGLQEETVQEGTHLINIQDEISVPPSLNQASTSKFSKQFRAMFNRKFYCTVRDRTTMIQLTFSLLDIILCNFITAQTGDAREQMGLFLYFSTIGFIINTNVYTSFPVSERENKVKYLLRTMGIHPLPYWLGTFCFDALISTTFGLLLIPIGYLLDVKLISQTLLHFTLIITAFGFSLLSQSYMMSWIYDKQQTVYKYHLLLSLCGLCYAPLILFGLLIGFDGMTYMLELKVIIVLLISFICSPALLLLLCNFLEPNLFTKLPPLACNTLLSDATDYANQPLLELLFANTNFYVLLMILQGTFYFMINIRLELRSLKLKVTKPKEVKPHAGIDVIPNPHEISNEKKRVRDPNNQDLTKALSLKKVYDDGFQALRKISFGVGSRQIFGLLGPNGAGKSTAFNTLTGLISKTSGEVFFNGHPLLNLHPQIFQSTGICPQFNPLWTDLSVRQHLRIIGQVKGLTKSQINDAIAYYTKILRMEEHLDKKSKDLSGGTLRKLCVANMLIGAPTVQFLDEPSTGLDPLSRRSLYDTITRNLEDRNASIILTTHSMSEAETLCSRIGILINGKFVCVGTLPYLKNKYGSGYKISVQKMDSDREVYEPVIFEAFPTAVEERDNSELFVNYRVKTEDFSFARAFHLMEDLKIKGQVSDFNIVNTTLEQVFIQFSRNQIQPTEEERI